MQEQTTQKMLTLNVRLSPVGESDQPVLANYSAVNVAQRMAYLDFGFIEPGALAVVAKMAQNGKPLPKVLEGKLSVRVSMSLDGIQRLHQQLGQVLTGLRGNKEATKQ